MSERKTGHQPSDAKRQWHAAQAQMPLLEKLRVVVELQRRQVAINEIKAALGLPTIPMRIWGLEP